MILTIGSRLRFVTSSQFTTSVALSRDEWRIISLIPDCYRVSHICARLQMHPAIILQHIERLLSLGIIELVQ